MDIAIIGASTGQKVLCETAKAMGLSTICFSTPEHAICRDLVDRFYPISILDTDRIIDICKRENIRGVVSNGSDLTAEISAIVSEKLGLVGNSSQSIKSIKNKEWVRQHTNDIPNLAFTPFRLYDGGTPQLFPCVVKPVSGSSKLGVSFAANAKEFKKAVAYSQEQGQEIIIEAYIPGKEYSVETLSFNGIHNVIQITEKKTTGFPHFVELEHHQPATLPAELLIILESVVSGILNNVGFRNGASHIEIKIDDSFNIHLIEINVRGGGDHIADTLIKLSTGYDYIRGMIEIALASFIPPTIRFSRFAGIYFLTKQTERLLPYFSSDFYADWLYERQLFSSSLTVSKGNRDNNGYLIYSSDHKINL